MFFNSKYTTIAIILKNDMAKSTKNGTLLQKFDS